MFAKKQIMRICLLGLLGIVNYIHTSHLKPAKTKLISSIKQNKTK